MELQSVNRLDAAGCGALRKTARLIGTAAGYFQRSSQHEMVADAERLVKRSPERSMMIAGAIGLMLGAIVRPRLR